MHWSEEYATTGRIDAVVNPVTDPISGQPESKHTPVAVRPYQPAWHGFALSREPLAFPDVRYQVRVRIAGGWRFELAGERIPEAWDRWARASLLDDEAHWLEYSDTKAGRYRAAAVHNQRLVACVLIGPDHALPSRGWLSELITRPELQPAERLNLLSGRSPEGTFDQGPVICSCFQVGLNTLIDAIRRQELMSTDAIGAALRAGTNCGSCLPELRNLIARTTEERAA